jgi:hypothetical protein
MVFLHSNEDFRSGKGLQLLITFSPCVNNDFRKSTLKIQDTFQTKVIQTQPCTTHASPLAVYLDNQVKVTLVS